MQRAGLNAGDFRIKLTEQRVDGRGMAGSLDVEGASELALTVELLHQREDLLARAAHCGHAGAGVDGGLDIAW